MKTKKILGNSGALLIYSNLHKDNRGFFTETWRDCYFEELNIPRMLQDNHSQSIKNALRGLHFQKKPKEVAKLIKCVNGEIYDVIVDIRPNSETFKQWFGVYLCNDSGVMVYVPKGFAHGFLTISQTADVIYKVSDYYAPNYDITLNWNDEDININWGIDKEKIIISDKDMSGQNLKELMGIL